MKKTALITGISGQDGSYLAEFLLSKDYIVHGTVLSFEYDDPENYLWRISNVLDQITIHPLNIENKTRVSEVIETVRPDECYHLAASSFVSYSFDREFSVFETNLDGTHFILSSIKEYVPDCKLFFAGSSEMFGKADTSPQNEDTPFNPRSPYGITKASAFFLSKYYRDYHELFTCNGISYNHESVRRGKEYVTRKITSGAAAIKKGVQKELFLGNLDAKRDWGYAPDYVQAMWLMLQMDQPDDYVLATGELHSVRDICEIAFGFLNLDYQNYVEVNPEFLRPESDVPLVGDASKAHDVLGWKCITSFQDTIVKMVENDLVALERS